MLRYVLMAAKFLAQTIARMLLKGTTGYSRKQPLSLGVRLSIEMLNSMLILPSATTVTALTTKEIVFTSKISFSGVLSVSYRSLEYITSAMSTKS